jgi:methylenetetrahydrofolate reductase (NADPH)
MEAMSRLESKIRDRTFVITAEIVPPLSAAPDALLAEAVLLGARVDAINVTDAAAGRTTMSSFAAAAILAQNGFEPILQVTCRDRNRIALAGDLLGAAAQRIENMLLLRGDDPKGGDQPDAKPVFDLETADLMRLARDMRDEGVLPSARPRQVVA